MRESGGNDWLTLAKCALEGGIRDELDLLMLLPDPHVRRKTAAKPKAPASAEATAAA